MLYLLPFCHPRLVSSLGDRVPSEAQLPVVPRRYSHVLEQTRVLLRIAAPFLPGPACTELLSPQSPNCAGRPSPPCTLQSAEPLCPAVPLHPAFILSDCLPQALSEHSA